MKIETAFDVNNIVIHKFSGISQFDSDKTQEIFEIMQIESQTCYAGTQNFYRVRPLILQYNTDWIDGKKTKTFTGIRPAHMSAGVEYCCYREDELISAPQNLIDLILSRGIQDVKNITDNVS